ncbi:MAG: hypothetical protein SF052_23695 [Bacteroidia bacterium]|nr:hypothetical protein [Bacteroidia bacterium]
MTDNFSAMKTNALEKLQAEKEKKSIQEENFSYSVNPNIEIDLVKFEQVLQTYTEILKKANRMNLASALLNGRAVFEHNKLIFSLENELLKQMVEKETDLLPYLRQNLNVAEIFWELKVDESLTPVRSHTPYTNEEKLSEMTKKNPNLKRLQEIFRTRIIYD